MSTEKENKKSETPVDSNSQVSRQGSGIELSKDVHSNTDDPTLHKQISNRIPESSVEDIFLERHQSHEIFNNFPLGYVIVTDSCLIQDINLSAALLLGQDQKELIGKSIESCFKQELPNPIQSFIREYSNSGINIQHEFIGIPKTAKTTYLRIQGSALSNSGIFLFALIDITDQKKIENQLNTLIEQAVDAILMGSPEGIIILANQKAFDITGYKEDELVGNPIEILFTREEQLRVPLQYDRLKKGEIVRSERLLKRKDGNMVTVEMNTKMMPDNSYQTIFRDMSERKKMEDALRSSEQKFTLAFKTSPDSININRVSDGVYIEINNSFTEITGYSKEEVIGRSSTADGLRLWVKDEDRIQLLEILEREGEITGFETAFRMKNGTIRYGLMAARFIDFGGEKCILSTTRDITERKISEESLKESEQSIRGIIDSVTESIYILSSEGRFIDVNVGATRMYGYSQAEMVGQIIEFVAAPGLNDLQHITELVMHTLETGETHQFEFWGKRKNGEYFPKDVICNKGKYFGKDVIIATARDISDRKKNDELLIAAKMKAEASEKLKSAFLANMSHEIRSPMNSIVGFSELLEDEDLTPDQRRDFISIIKNGGKHLLTIINDIIDFAKIDSNQLTISPNNINLNQLLDDILMETEVEKKKAGKHAVELILKKAFPDNNCTIISDDVRLKQILLNLIGNALKFTEQGSIKIEYGVQSDQIVFCVQDTGKGIAKDKQDIIFERFRQEEESTTRKYGGTGLGLSISKGLVELLQGKIWLESEPGSGASFFFSLPISIWTGHIDAESKENKPKAKFDFEGKCILVAEDVYSNFRLINYMLSKTNATVIYAENGAQAVDLCRSEERIDLILMDIQMPVMDGYEATSEIRKFLPKLPIIALTAYSFSDKSDESLLKGCNDYLTKPVDKETMLEKARKYLFN
ncbi:MAG: PAS domain S-box protein [Bacteroidetes bacterium]|nr:PAS domain S-box protein [Bacteroidota bacterium]